MPDAAVAAAEGRGAARLRAVLELRGDVWVRCEGWSMWPTVRDGDEVLLEPVADARSGDVVLVELGPRLVLHRVRATGGAGISTIGDAARDEDGRHDAERIIGRAVAVRRPAGAVAALEPTLRFGHAALLRWAAARLRLAAARVWRRATA